MTRHYEEDTLIDAKFERVKDSLSKASRARSRGKHEQSFLMLSHCYRHLPSLELYLNMNLLTLFSNWRKVPEIEMKLIVRKREIPRIFRHFLSTARNTYGKG